MGAIRAVIHGGGGLLGVRVGLRRGAEGTGGGGGHFLLFLSGALGNTSFPAEFSN